MEILTYTQNVRSWTKSGLRSLLFWDVIQHRLVVTFQKSEDRIYTLAEAGKHAKSGLFVELVLNDQNLK